jgi:ferredoxin
VAIQLANAIRLMGYPARAHVEANYQLICTLVAQDAGLGEIGRMGLVITPHHGPRVRLAAVTTSLELLTDNRRDGSAVVDFCTVCKKCALNCPSQSIPLEDRQEIDGALRWRINADTCLRYWMTAGTDCGRCLTVCPYSHPDNFYHNLVRRGIERSALFRRGAYALDDMLYGKKSLHPISPRNGTVSKPILPYLLTRFAFSSHPVSSVGATHASPKTRVHIHFLFRGGPRPCALTRSPSP